MYGVAATASIKDIMVTVDDVCPAPGPIPATTVVESCANLLTPLLIVGVALVALGFLVVGQCQEDTAKKGTLYFSL